MKKRLFVFSVDAMVHEDVEYLRTKPNFQKYLMGGASVKHVRTIYPSVTYPIHVSMLTGCYPEKHGVFSNISFTTDNKEEAWQWEADIVKSDDIFAAAKRAGYSTASVFWPVTGNHKHVDYLLNEYWMPYPGDTLLGSFQRDGTSDEVLKIVEKNKGLLPPSYVKALHHNFMVQPYIDNFLIECACDIIREFTPEVMFVHNGIMDNTRHKNGVFNDRVTAALDNVDENLGRMMHALEEKGVLEDTNVVMVSDHGQMDYARIIKPNVFLARKGLIDVSPEGKVLDWRAFCMSNAMSSMCYLKDPNDQKLYDEVYRLLTDMAEEGIYGFTKVFTREEIRRLEHLDGSFSFVLETDGYTSFSDACTAPVIGQMDLSDFRFGRATHGYLPDKGAQPVFEAKGPAFRNGVTLERRPIVDEAPTFAKILGVELPEAQGVPMNELLKA